MEGRERVVTSKESRRKRERDEIIKHDSSPFNLSYGSVAVQKLKMKM